MKGNRMGFLRMVNGNRCCLVGFFGNIIYIIYNNGNSDAVVKESTICNTKQARNGGIHYFMITSSSRSFEAITLLEANKFPCSRDFPFSENLNLG